MAAAAAEAEAKAQCGCKTKTAVTSIQQIDSTPQEGRVAAAAAEAERQCTEAGARC